MKTSILLLTLALSSFGASPLFAEEHFRVLVFSKTAGYRHQSIEPGIAALQNLGGAHNFAVEQTEDASVFREENLSRFHAVIFLCTTGTLFTPAQRDAFQNFIRRGGGFVGVDSAADTEYDWPWYGELVGTYFRSHTAVVGAQVRVEDRLHPATRHLPARWTHTDEWYSFRANPRGQVHVLLSLDGRTLSGTEMGFDHR
jgi:cytochrome c